MEVTHETIDATVNAVVSLSSLGGRGFIFFSIFIVICMFFFMGWIAMKALKSIMENHKENEQRIDEAHSRIYTLEVRESKCLDRVDKVTTELESCAKDFKLLTQTMKDKV